MTTGCRKWPSSWFTPTTTARMIRALAGPLATNATSTDNVPATVAPTSGMKDPRNTMTPSGNASGTRRISKAAVMPTASTVATIAVRRT